MAHEMVIRSDARAMGAVTALNTTNRRKPRASARALTDCVCYNADGTVIRVIPRVSPTRATTTHKSKIRTAPQLPGMDYFHRLAQLGATGNVE